MFERMNVSNPQSLFFSRHMEKFKIEEFLPIKTRCKLLKASAS